MASSTCQYAIQHDHKTLSARNAHFQNCVRKQMVTMGDPGKCRGYMAEIFAGDNPSKDGCTIASTKCTPKTTPSTMPSPTAASRARRTANSGRATTEPTTPSTTPPSKTVGSTPPCTTNGRVSASVPQTSQAQAKAAQQAHGN